jgi:hypothetical protein
MISMIIGVGESDNYSGSKSETVFNISAISMNKVICYYGILVLRVAGLN